ncbi:MAG: hypothetical protein CMG98_13505 [Marinovum sp.]|nr:hypothetical protein [Marinovum sp.]
MRYSNADFKSAKKANTPTKIKAIVKGFKLATADKIERSIKVSNAMVSTDNKKIRIAIQMRQGVSFSFENM